MAGAKKEEAKDAGAGGDEAKQKKKKMFMFIGIGVLLVLVSVGATFFIVSKMMAGKTAEGGESKSSEAAEVHEAPPIYLPLKPNFTVNYDVAGRQRFLQADIALMYRDPAVAKLLEEHMPAIRNSLVMTLSNQTFDELQTSEGKEKLRAAALEVVQEIISKEAEAAAAHAKDKKDAHATDANVEQLLFTQFIMQ